MLDVASPSIKVLFLFQLRGSAHILAFVRLFQLFSCRFAKYLFMPTHVHILLHIPTHTHTHTSKRCGRRKCAPSFVCLQNSERKIPFLAEQIDVCQAVANVSENLENLEERRKNNLHIAWVITIVRSTATRTETQHTTILPAFVLPNWGKRFRNLAMTHKILPKKDVCRFRVFAAAASAACALHIVSIRMFRDILHFFTQCGSAVAEDAS